MDNEQLQKKIAGFQRNWQYKNKTLEEITAIARGQLLQKEIDISSMFSDEDEKLKAKELVKKYLIYFVPQTISDVNNLRSLIYLEIIQDRLQIVMNNLTKGNKAIPINLVDSIHKNLRELTAQKERLGLVGSEKEKVKNDAYLALELVRDKFKRWLENNQGTRDLSCPHCGQMVMLKMRVDRWDVKKHPFFKDRWLTNEHLMRLYTEGKLTAEDVAKVLEVSTDYVTEWLIDRWEDKKVYDKEQVLAGKRKLRKQKKAKEQEEELEKIERQRNLESHKSAKKDRLKQQSGDKND